MSALESTGVEPRTLTIGDKLFLNFAFLVTLLRVAGLLGAAFSLLVLGFSIAFAVTPDFNQLGHIGIFIGVYVLATIIMYYISQKTYSTE